MTRIDPKTIGTASTAAILAAASVFIAQHEGLVLGTYRDPINVITACYGHTGPELQMGQQYTPAECRAMLDKDVLIHAKRIAPCIERPLPAKVLISFISFAFNVGWGAFCKSPVAANWNAGLEALACKRMNEGPDGRPRWVYAKGKVLPGLVKRRADERALCEEGLA
jgi:lysozyme